MVQVGFYINTKFCTGCEACVVSCKDAKDLDVGVSFRRVYEHSEGSYGDENHGILQNIQTFFTSISCNHCDEPTCIPNCPTTAIYKREEDGVVLIDHDKCVGCRYCEWNCPYGAPQYDEVLGKMTKCDTCIDLREAGEEPACVAACPMRAIEFGPIEELREKYGDTADIKGLPSSKISKPNLVINQHKHASK